ncbi:MAG: helix-turn-helix transcriptional regulator [Bacteroidales bacterium]|nr:helix-turn-helix transcriptional regulator [Bacteroidales bacterium]
MYTDCTLSLPNASVQALTRATFAAQLSAPSIVPFVILYYRRMRNITRQQHPLELMWVIVPVVLFTASGVAYFLSGEEHLVEQQLHAQKYGYSAIAQFSSVPVRLYYMISVVLYRIALTIEALWLAVYIIILAAKEKFRLRNVFRFYFKGDAIKLTGLHTFYLLPAYFLILLRFIFFRDVLFKNTWMAIGYSVLLTFFIVAFAYVALFAQVRTISRKQMRNSWRYNYSNTGKPQVVEQMLDDLLDDAEEDAIKRIQGKLNEDLPIEALRTPLSFVDRSDIAARVFSAVSDSWGENELLVRFQHLMRDEHLFLQPRLSLDDVADKLGTNKFYVSKLVNNAYNLGFPEVINILRVDYAEQYILNHRGAKQDEIARQCGFLSASSFITIFKRVTGVTPKVWMAAKDHSE